MANLLSIREIGERTGGMNDQGIRTAQRKFLLQWDSPTVGRAEVLAAAGLPQLYFPYIVENEIDVGLLVRDVQPRQHEVGYFWEVVVEYSSQTLDPSFTQVENPLLRPPDISWGSESVEIALVKDYNFTTDQANDGDPILNSADEAFDPPPATTDELLVLNYSRNVASIAPVTRRDQKNKVNSLPWFGFEAEVAKLADWNATLGFENNVQFWKESFTIKIAKWADFWWFVPLDQGYYEIVGGNRRLILDSAGRALQTPALLDGAGAQLAVGGDPVFLDFIILGSFDFNILGLV